MPFVDQLQPASKAKVLVRKNGYDGEANKYVRYNHKNNSWQRMGSFGWFDVSITIAKMLIDQGFKVWGAE